MDFLNRAFAQASDLFRSMTPGARITAGLLLAVVVVSLSYLFNHQVAGGDTLLLGGQHFSAGDLKAMQAAFGTAGLNDYDLDGAQIRVPRGRQDVYMAALVDAGAMPADFNTYLNNAVKELGSPFMERRQVEALMKNAKQDTIAGIIRVMDGVKNAQVLYETKKAGGLHGGEITTASVSVQLVGQQSLTANQVKGIRGLVGSSIGIPPNEVTVVDLSGKTYMGGSDDFPGAGGDHAYAEATETFNNNYRTKIEEALAHITGVTVSVNVVVTDEISQLETSVKHDPKTVAAFTEEETSTSTNEPVTPAGPPGFGSQQPGQGANAPAALTSGRSAQRSEEERTSSQQQNLVSRDEMTVKRIGLIPETVSATVVVPTSYYRKVWLIDNPSAPGEAEKTPTPADLDQITQETTTTIKSLVETLIARDGTVEAAPKVTVASLPDMPAAELPTIGMSDKALGWFGQYWSTLGMIGLAMFSLVMLRSMVRSVPSPAPATASAVATGTSTPSAGAAEPPSGEEAPKKAKRKFGKGPSARDDLVELVRDDPDAAAAILKGWIGNPT